MITSPGDALELRSSGAVNTAGNTVSIDFTTNVYPTAGRNVYFDASQDSSNRGKLTIGTYGTVGGSTTFYDILQIHAQDGNAVISGSSISTGSFGSITTPGRMTVGAQLTVAELSQFSSTMQFVGSQTIETSGGSDNLTIAPQANLNLGTTSTDNIIIGASSRNTTINSTTTTINNTLAAATITGTTLTTTGNISGSATSTGSFGKLHLKGGPDDRDRLILLDDGSSYISGITKKAGSMGGLFVRGNGSSIGILTNGSYATNPTGDTVAVSVNSTTSAVTFPVANQKISGSSTSTGSFGMVHGANEIRINPTKTINTTVDNNYWVLYGGTSGNGANIALSGNSRSTYGGRLDIAAGNVDSSGVIAFNTGGSERMQIDYSGRVGIGTSTPDVKLQVMGSTAVSGSESGNLDFTVRNTHASALSRVIVQNNGVDQNMILFADDANDYGSVGSSTGGSNNIRFKTGTDAYFEGGKFGINAVNPQYDLHVSGSGFVGIAAQSSGSGAGMFSDDINGRSYIMLDDNVSGHSGFGSGTDYTSFMRQNAKTTLISYGSTQGFEIGNYSSDEIDFITNNIRRMTIEAGGSVEVVGALSKGSGTFRIPHPVPEKKDKLDLQHSFVESPTRGDNIYRWQVEVQNNQHIIELPDYYQYLNENDMVWVNSVNHFGRGYGNVNDEQTELTITTDTDGLYNVLLIGTRKDETAMNNFKGIEVERKLETFKGVVPPK